MSRITMIVLLLLASFGAYAEADMSAFERLNAKIDCIAANGGIYSKRAKAVCADTAKTAPKAVAAVEKPATYDLHAKLDCIDAHGGFHSKKAKELCIDTSGVAKAAKIDTRPRDAKGLYHWKKVNSNPAKAAYRNAAKGAHPEVFIGKKVHDDLIAIGLSSNDMDKVFHPIFNQVLGNYGLLKGKDAADHTKQWDEMFRNGTRYPDFIQKGDILRFLSFRNGVVRDVVVDFEGNLPVFVFPLENGRELLWIPRCQNFAIREGKQAIPPEKPEKIVPYQPKRPSISIHKEENQKRALAIAEINLGVWAGKYWGSHYGGTFSGTKDLIYIPISGMLGWEEQVSIGAGIYGAREAGNSHDSKFRGRSSRLLPIIAVKGNGFGGIGGDDVIHQWSVSLGYGSDSMAGHNSESGWRFNQQTKMGMAYAEWVEQYDKWVYGVAAEGFLGLSEKHHATFSGTPAEGRSTGRIGGLVEYRFHPHISAKLVANATYADGNIERFGAEFGGYLCGRGGWSRGQDFAIACGGGGIGIGQGVIPFVGVNAFAGHVFTMYVEAEKAKKIFYAPAEYPKEGQRVLSTIPGSFMVINPGNSDGKQDKH
ncbi:MAG: hypothetical protein PHT88_00090 [Candidatus Moranbacteria bacterium]|nr:hypothetical protein [Candidatus Moranbacteria bacterium]